MKQRFYLDTSIFGGLFDAEFEKETTILFERIKLGQIICVYSDLTETELARAPEKVRGVLDGLAAEQKKKVTITTEIIQLAETYIRENVVGKTSFDDCIHIAAATIYKADLLVSWNFKHIVNIYRIRGYNAINLKLGYQNLSIHSPKEIVGNENDIAKDQAF